MCCAGLVDGNTTRFDTNQCCVLWTLLRRLDHARIGLR